MTQRVLGLLVLLGWLHCCGCGDRYSIDMADDTGDRLPRADAGQCDSAVVEASDAAADSGARDGGVLLDAADHDRSSFDILSGLDSSIPDLVLADLQRPDLFVPDTSYSDERRCRWPDRIDGGLAPNGRYTVERTSHTWLEYPWPEPWSEVYEEVYDHTGPIFDHDRIGYYRNSYRIVDAGAVDGAAQPRRERTYDVLWIERGTGVISIEQPAIGDIFIEQPEYLRLRWPPLCQTGTGFVVDQYLYEDLPDGGIRVQISEVMLDGEVLRDISLDMSCPEELPDHRVLGCHCVGPSCFVYTGCGGQEPSSTHMSFNRMTVDVSAMDDSPRSPVVARYEMGIATVASLYGPLEVYGVDVYPALWFLLDNANDGQISRYSKVLQGARGAGRNAGYYDGKTVQCGSNICVIAELYEYPPPHDFRIERAQSDTAIVRVNPVDGGFEVVEPHICVQTPDNIFRGEHGFVVGRTERWFNGLLRNAKLLFYDTEARFVQEVTALWTPDPEYIDGESILAWYSIVPDGDGWFVIYWKDASWRGTTFRDRYGPWLEFYGMGISRWRLIDTWADGGPPEGGSPDLLHEDGSTMDQAEDAGSVLDGGALQ